jgi:phage shock protein PspC (stress-responsive transcriptional regulator)
MNNIFQINITIIQIINVFKILFKTKIFFNIKSYIKNHILKIIY